MGCGVLPVCADTRGATPTPRASRALDSQLPLVAAVEGLFQKRRIQRAGIRTFDLRPVNLEHVATLGPQAGAGIG